MEDPPKEKGIFTQIVEILSSLLSIFKEWISGKNKEREQKDKEEFYRNEAAKKTVEERNRAESLVEQLKNAKTPEEKKRILDEIRKKTSK